MIAAMSDAHFLPLSVLASSGSAGAGLANLYLLIVLGMLAVLALCLGLLAIGLLGAGLILAGAYQFSNGNYCPGVAMILVGFCLVSALAGGKR
jgi:hypothetical protein